MHRATQPFRWAALAATLVLAMGMAIVWSPAARATAITCDVNDSTHTLEIELDTGDSVTLTHNGHDVVVTGACTDDFDSRGPGVGGDNFSAIDIVGTDEGDESVEFDEDADPWGWAGLYTITVDLGTADEGDDSDYVQLTGTTENDTMNAQTLAAYTGVEDVYVYGGDGEDTITGALSIPNWLDGEDDADTITGGNMDDYIHGGNDGAEDEMHGGGGDDTFDECSDDTGSDVIEGGTGSDTVDYSDRSASIYVSLGADGAAATTGNGDEDEDDSIYEIENVLTGSGNDEIHGNGEANVLNPGTGTEEEISGGGGTDTLDYSDNGAAMSIDLATGESPAQSAVEDTNDDGDFVDGADKEDDISGFRNVVGSGDDDEISGSGDANVIEGGPGSDVVDGREGNDWFDEGSDDDGSTSEDVISGGSGVDTLDYSGRPYAEDAPGVNAELDSTWGEDDMTAADIENMYGSPGEDTLYGSDLRNTIWGLGSDDQIYGHGGDSTEASGDSLYGGDGDDDLFGEYGKDRLVGGNGEDDLYGGAGDDILNGTKDGDDDTYDGGGETRADSCIFESQAELDAHDDSDGSTTVYEDTGCERISPRKFARNYLAL